MILVVNKVDRPDARIEEVVNEVYELFLDLDADEEQIDFPIIYANARAGWASLDPEAEGSDLKPLFELLLEHIPAPTFEEGHPLQALVTNLDASPYLGRLALCRIKHGELKKGQTVAWCKLDGSIENVRITELYVAEALDRVDAEVAGAGEICAIAGLAEVTIGETLADADNPVALPAITVDEPSLSMTIGINTSPLAGKEGTKLTARLVKQRLDSELVGNVSIRVLPTERPDAWEVQGRGELQLAVLVETMRREGFELTVGKPQVVTREIDGKLHEPVERVAIDVPEDYLGVVTQLVALRKGRLEQMVNHGTGWVRMDYVVPARGLIGFRTEFLTETRGTGILHHVFQGYEKWFGELRSRPNGSLVSDRRGVSTGYALFNLQERGGMLIGPVVEVYEGMIVGENSRSEEMDINVTREKKLTNTRSASADDMIRLTPAAADVARAGAGVHRRRRVRRGHARDACGCARSSSTRTRAAGSGTPRSPPRPDPFRRPVHSDRNGARMRPWVKPSTWNPRSCISVAARPRRRWVGPTGRSSGSSGTRTTSPATVTTAAWCACSPRVRRGRAGSVTRPVKRSSCCSAGASTSSRRSTASTAPSSCARARR